MAVGKKIAISYGFHALYDGVTRDKRGRIKVLKFNMTIIETGEKVNVVTRRNFAEDLRRHFAGTVEAVDGAIVRVHGYTFVFNPVALEYRRRPEVRTRIFNLADAQLIVNVLPTQVEIDQMEYRMIDGRLVVTDGRKFKLDVNEFGTTS